MRHERPDLNRHRTKSPAMAMPYMTCWKSCGLKIDTLKVCPWGGHLQNG